MRKPAFGRPRNEVSGVKDAKVCHYRGVAFVEFDAKTVDLRAVQKLSEALDFAAGVQRRSAQSAPIFSP